MQQHLETALVSPPSASYVAPGADHDLLAMLADAAAQRGDLRALETYAPQAEAIAVRLGHQLYLGIANRAQGVAGRLAGDHDRAEQRLNEALGIFTALGTRWQLGRTHIELGLLARLRQDSDAAFGHYSQALAHFSALGARPDADRARQAIETLR